MSTDTGLDLPAKTSPNDPRAEALDLLIDQYQRLFALYDARQSSAEAKAAGILTATVAVAALTATAASLVKHVNVALAVVLVVLLAISVIFAIYAASAAGLREPRRREDQAELESPLLSTESTQYRDAAKALNITADEILRACRDTASEAITARVYTLELWRERQLDAHHLAQKKDRGSAYAGITLGLALACGAAIVVLIVTHSG